MKRSSRRIFLGHAGVYVSLATGIGVTNEYPRDLKALHNTPARVEGES